MPTQCYVYICYGCSQPGNQGPTGWENLMMVDFQRSERKGVGSNAPARVSWVQVRMRGNTATDVARVIRWPISLNRLKKPCPSSSRNLKPSFDSEVLNRSRLRFSNFLKFFYLLGSLILGNWSTYPLDLERWRPAKTWFKVIVLTSPPLVDWPFQIAPPVNNLQYLYILYGANHLKVNTRVQIKPLPQKKSPALFLCRIYSKWWSEEILLRVFFYPQNWVRYIQDLSSDLVAEVYNGVFRLPELPEAL